MRCNQLKDAKKHVKRKRQRQLCDRIGMPRRGRMPSIRAPHARRFDLWPGDWVSEFGGFPWSRIDLRIARSRIWMLREIALLGDVTTANDWGTRGACCARHRSCVRGINTIVRAERGRIAVVLLNERDLLRQPSELLAHEVTHAAMRFLESRDAELGYSGPREEALAYTVGSLVRQANRIFYAHVWRRDRIDHDHRRRSGRHHVLRLALDRRH